MSIVVANIRNFAFKTKINALFFYSLAAAARACQSGWGGTGAVMSISNLLTGC